MANIKKIIVLIVLLSVYVKDCMSQENKVFYEAPDITTVIFNSEREVRSLPIISLGSGEKLELQFDEIEGNTRTLMYSFTHYSATWQPSDIIEMEYVRGLNKIYDVEKSQLSFNTTTDYVHYDMVIDTEPIRISGNYVVRVYDANDEQLLISRPFLVTEDLVGINSRIERKGSVGQATHNVSFSVVHPSLKINTPAVEVKIAVWQNMRMPEAIYTSSPTFLRNNEMVFDDDNLFSFEASNECRWIDNRSLKYARYSTASIDYYEPYYHFTLYSDDTPKGYYYQEDFNGFRHIEANDIYDDPKFAADYNMVHFTLPRQQNDVDVYVYGDLTNWTLDDRNIMDYDDLNHCYTLTLRVKQGLHNYQYMSVSKGTKKPQLSIIENSFPETENNYYIAVYYRSYSDTYDRLVGIKRHNSLKTLNSFIH